MTLEYDLRESTAEEYMRLISINFESWGHPLSLKDYIDREFLLAKISKDYRKSWVFVRGQEILSSCETYEIPLIAKIDGRIIRGTSHGVASVFTPVDQRGNGYASLMMKMLYNKIFDSKRGLIGSHLYSDVGPHFYSKNGWNLFPSVCAQLDVKSYKSVKPKGLIRTICLPDLELLLKDDIDRLMADMKDNSFLLEPTIQSISWLNARSVFIAGKLGKPIPNSVGIGCEGAFLLWFLSFKEDTLFVIRLHAPNSSLIPNLIEAAVSEANYYGLSKIVIWNPDGEYWSKIDSVKIIKREDSLSSMALQYEGSKLDNCCWVLNEKYAWV